MPQQPVYYRTVEIDGLSIFYREAGPKDAQFILLLHGLPSSSRMFEPLFARFSDQYHLIAPDYPGFGHNVWPDPQQYQYFFDNIAATMTHFTETLGLMKYTLYMQDYGGPVGFRMMLTHHKRVQSLIVQGGMPDLCAEGERAESSQQRKLSSLRFTDGDLGAPVAWTHLIT